MKVLYGLLVLAFKVHSLRGVRAFLVSNLYPFGKDSGDASLPIEDDLTSPKINVPPFAFYGSAQNALYVSENGFISFEREPRDSTPARLPLTYKGQAAVPYWADVYTPRGGEVWYRFTTERSITTRATKDVKRAFPVYKEFVANWVFIATWSNVTYYGASPSYKHKRNTFQAILATDGDMSFIAYIYRKLTWTTGTLNGGNEEGLRGTPAQIGFSSGDAYYKLPGSGTGAVLELTHTSNCGQPGVWFFRVDDVTMIDKERCESKDALTVFPPNSPIRSGDNIVINGLCYRPTTVVRCDFGDVGVIGYYVNDTAAFCTVPFVARPTQIPLSVILSEPPSANVTQTMTIEPIHFLHMHVKRLQPRSWTMGSHVNVTWNPLELVADQPVTLEIMTFIEVNGTMKVHHIVTVVREQPNTGQTEFHIPQFDTRWNITESQKALSFVRVRGKLNSFHNKYAPKQWIWSDLFSLTNQSLSNESCARWHANQSQAMHSNKVVSGFATPVSCRSLDISFANGVVSGQRTNPGDRYKFTCNKGFLLIGENEIVCGKDGSWSAQVPICKIGNCSRVSIDNARVRSQNDPQLVITCNDGYILVGPRVLSCEVDGTLNGTLPSCIRGEQRRTTQATQVLPVIIIGIVVLIVALVVIVVTVYLVRKHRKRKNTRTSREMIGKQQGALV